MRITVTGSKGFIGTHLCRALNAKGFQVAEIDAVDGGVLNKDLLKKTVDGSDMVIHLAAVTGSRRSASFDDYYDVNVIGTRNVAECCIDLKIPRLIHASAISVKTLRSPYAVTKAMAETLGRGLSRQNGVDYVGLRICNAYGPGQSPKSGALVPSVIDDIKTGRVSCVHGSGQQTRDFIYVDDVVQCFIGAVECEAPFSGLCIDVGTGWSTRVLALVRMVYEIAGKQPHLKLTKADSETAAHWSRADTSLCRERFNIASFVRLQEGLQTTWLASNRKGGS
jgi:UDP-glucose 4-epimerase